MAISKILGDMRRCRRSAALFFLLAFAVCRHESSSFFASTMGIVVGGPSQDSEALASAVRGDPSVFSGRKKKKKTKSLLLANAELHAERTIPGYAEGKTSSDGFLSMPPGHARGVDMLLLPSTTVHSISPRQLRREQHPEEQHPAAFIKLKDTMRTVWESVKAGASKVKNSFNGGQVLSVMTSPALAGTGSPLAMPPVVQPVMDVQEATSMHGAFIVLMCVAMVTILLAIVMACYCVKRHKKHEKVMRMKAKDLVK